MQSIASTRADGDLPESLEEKKKIEADEFRTKNIDDFVPDDFPQLKMELSEIKRIYRKISQHDNVMTLGEIGKLNGALDRVIRQYKINKAKEDGIRQQKLIAKQLEEERIAKRLALREQKDLERKARTEEARRRLQLRKEEEEHKLRLKKLEIAQKAEAKRLEKEARELFIAEEKRRKEEIARLEKEKAELDKARKTERERIEQLRSIQNARIEEELFLAEQKEAQTQYLHDKYTKKELDATENLAIAKDNYTSAMEKYKAEEEKLFAENIEHVKSIANRESERIALEEEALMLDRISEEKNSSAKRIKALKIETIEKMRSETEKHWLEQQKMATQLAINLKVGILREFESEETKKIILTHEKAEEALLKLQESFAQRLTVEEMSAIDSLISYASKNMSEKDILAITEEFDRNVRKRNKQRRINRLKERLASIRNGKNKK